MKTSIFFKLAKIFNTNVCQYPSSLIESLVHKVLGLLNPDTTDGDNLTFKQYF